MSRYFAILTPTTKRLFMAWISAGLLIVYLVFPLYPNVSVTVLNILYILMQITVASGLLFPLLIRWRYCSTLRLMPYYNQMIK